MRPLATLGTAFVLLLLQAGSACAASADDIDQQPIVVSLAHFVNETTTGNVDQDLIALRHAVVYELVKNYGCVVVGRSHGLDLCLERSVTTIRSITSDSGEGANGDRTVAADVAVYGFLQDRLGAPEIALHTVDLRRPDAARSESRIKFRLAQGRLSVAGLAKSVATAAATVLHLSKTKPIEPTATIPLEQTWAVLPFGVLNRDGDAASAGIGSMLSLRALLALQGNAARHVVDRDRLAAVLNEMTLADLAGASELSAAGIARIVGADRIVMGCVNCLPKGAFEIYVQLVDAATGLVLDGQAATVANQKELGNLSETLVSAISTKPKRPIIDGDSPGSSRLAESKFYFDMLDGIEYLDHRRREWGIVAQRLACAEAAFLLATDDEMRSKIVAITWEKCSEEPLPLRVYSNVDTPCLSPEQSKYVRQVIAAMVGQLAPAQQRNAHVYLAAATAWSGDPRMALEILDTYELDRSSSSMGGRQESRVAQLIRGDSLYLLGRYAEAIKVYAGQPSPLYERIARCCFRQGDERQEFDALSELSFMKNSITPERLRYIRLRSEMRPAQENVDLIETDLGHWVMDTPEVQLEYARALLAVGNKSKASALCSGLSEQLARGRSPSMLKMSQIREELETLKEECGSAAIAWKTLGEIKPFPAEYPLYVQPFGDVDLRMVTDAATNAAAFLQTVIKVLPPLPMPQKDDAYYWKEQNRWSKQSLRLMATYGATVPDDAFLVFYITREDFGPSPTLWLWSSSYPDGSVWITYHWWERRNRSSLTETVAKGIAWNIPAMLLRKGRCANPACLFSGSGDASGPTHKRFAICEDCQKWYRSADVCSANKYSKGFKIKLDEWMKGEAEYNSQANRYRKWVASQKTAGNAGTVDLKARDEPAKAQSSTSRGDSDF